jgi:hypothetical protein
LRLDPEAGALLLLRGNSKICDGALLVVGQFRAMSLLFSCCSSAEECGNEKGRRHFRAAADRAQNRLL